MAQGERRNCQTIPEVALEVGQRGEVPPRGLWVGGSNDLTHFWGGFLGGNSHRDPPGGPTREGEYGSREEAPRRISSAKGGDSEAADGR